MVNCRKIYLVGKTHLSSLSFRLALNYFQSSNGPSQKLFIPFLDWKKVKNWRSYSKSNVSRLKKHPVYHTIGKIMLKLVIFRASRWKKVWNNENSGNFVIWFFNRTMRGKIVWKIDQDGRGHWKIGYRDGRERQKGWMVG